MEIDFEFHRARTVKKMSYSVIDFAINCNGSRYPAKLSEVRRLLLEQRKKIGEYHDVMQWFRESSNAEFYAFVLECRDDQQAIGQVIDLPRYEDYVV
jgi:hypothetical protein